MGGSGHTAGTMDVSDRIRRVIEAEGPITFDRYMDLALYGPGGFFESPPIGTDAGSHFATSPHVHPIFGQLLGVAVEGLWAAMGEPLPFDLLEVGAGDGTLARQLLRALPSMTVRYKAAERSPLAREALQAFADSNADVAVFDGYEGLAAFRGVAIANELLDNLPFRRIRGVDRGAVELRVGLDPATGAFVEVEQPTGIEVSQASPEDLPPGEEDVVGLEALAFIDRLAAILLEGYVILIDYGDEHAGDVHGYRAHRVVDDVLTAPGTCDITAGVDFTAIAERASSHRFQVFGPVSQHDALMGLGFIRWMEAERSIQASLLGDGQGVDAVRKWGERQAATMLVDPDGLGRLRWLVLATPDLPRPPWTIPNER